VKCEQDVCDTVMKGTVLLEEEINVLTKLAVDCSKKALYRAVRCNMYKILGILVFVVI